MTGWNFLVGDTEFKEMLKMYPAKCSELALKLADKNHKNSIRGFKSGRCHHKRSIPKLGNVVVEFTRINSWDVLEPLITRRTERQRLGFRKEDLIVAQHSTSVLNIESCNAAWVLRHMMLMPHLTKARCIEYMHRAWSAQRSYWMHYYGFLVTHFQLRST